MDRVSGADQRIAPVDLVRQNGTADGNDRWCGDVTLSRSLRVSPDGRTIAEGREINGNVDLWFVETARGVLRRFTLDSSLDNNPVWSPDGSRVAFFSRRSGPQNVWVKPVDGGTDERLRESAQNEVPTDWSRDGRFILFTEGLNDVWALPVDGAGDPIAVTHTNFIEDQGRFSPDGRSVAYQSNETGRNEIYVVPFPAPGVPLQMSTNGGVTPQWRDDGREILYLGEDRKLMAVAVTRKPDGKLEVGRPAALFTIPRGAAYDITRDGQRILIDAPIGQATTPPITIIQNWKPRS